MNICIVHYHLKPGGVTRVIEHAASSLIALGHRVLVLASEKPTEDLSFAVRVVPALRYTLPNEKIDPGALAFEMKRVARAEFDALPDVWHIHNHCLGKNAAIPEAAAKLALERSVLLQIHDFAEDGRPANYALLRSQLSDISKLYPVGPQIHYAVLNGRDYQVLETAKLSKSNLHFLPNAVSVPQTTSSTEEVPEAKGRRLVLYPTRGIRRKNMGEFLLLAALADSDTLLASTLGPANPTARPIYDNWVDLARELQIPVYFGLGEDGRDFGALMSAADEIITTSVAEGFGLAFLEPWLFGKPLVGRDLPEVTGEFRDTGVNLDNLYGRFTVPLDWVGETEFRATLKHALEKYYQTYGESLPENAEDRAFSAAVNSGMVDFGRLDERLQEIVIRRVVNDHKARHALWGLMKPSLPQADVEKNQKTVLEHYSLDAYGQRLTAIYDAMIAQGSGGISNLPSDVILKEFLKPERFCLLRT
ncbi:glycosyltransferase family 4 protein [Rubellicoccus peritrichatus]|uniref:Glycosyltransferase family 4 protein n=1 Tax=Rubellicoccus peritrichatus TaxID=3080537 RepID=A0AAQ3LA52_9BACT|nr:glycosyltransferase family 4 protein [Puniceicoccus sp. CR14]WOO40764.1 glycosyltransferase family 4 protein [Puniceicoccus sp. CR14]